MPEPSADRVRCTDCHGETYVVVYDPQLGKNVRAPCVVCGGTGDLAKGTSRVPRPYRGPRTERPLEGYTGYDPLGEYKKE